MRLGEKIHDKCSPSIAGAAAAGARLHPPFRTPSRCTAHHLVGLTVISIIHDDGKICDYYYIECSIGRMNLIEGREIGYV